MKNKIAKEDIISDDLFKLHVANLLFGIDELLDDDHMIKHSNSYEILKSYLIKYKILPD
jgi:hypothetical protein